MGTRRHVHVAGRGAVSGFGAGVQKLVDAVFAGRSAVRLRERTAPIPAPTAVAAEVPPECLPPAGSRCSLAAHLAVLAARQALAEADADPAAVQLVLASTKADLSGLLGPGTGEGQPARLARRVAEELELAGVLAAVSAACASGLVGLSLAARRLARGEVEQVLVVGIDVLTSFTMAGFGGLHALDPEPCRPFDIRRRGISLGEGAAALLLTADGSRSIGVRLSGHGVSNDAFHALQPDAQGDGLVLAAQRALCSAGLTREQVDLLHAHGTGTTANDQAEARGLARLFRGATPPAFGTKGQTGHTLGASGVLESLLVIAAMERRCVPANAGLEEPDVDAGLDLVRAARSLGRARHALKVAGGFGGLQAALVFST